MATAPRAAIAAYILGRLTLLGCLKFERENTWFSGPDHLALNSVLDIFGALAGGVSVWNFEY